MDNLENEKKMTKFETDLDNIKDLLLDIKDELKNMNQMYIPRNELIEMFKNRDEKSNELKEQIKTIKENQNSAKQQLIGWLSIMIAAMALIYSILK